MHPHTQNKPFFFITTRNFAEYQIKVGEHIRNK